MKTYLEKETDKLCEAHNIIENNLSNNNLINIMYSKRKHYVSISKTYTKSKVQAE